MHNRPSLGKPALALPATGLCLRGLAATIGLAVALATVSAGSAVAQFYPFPSDSPPRPPASMNRTPPAPIPAPAPIPGPQGGTQWGARNPICAQLEQRLVAENQRGAQYRDQLPRIEAELRQATLTSQQGNAQLERADCFEYFLFSKTLRGTRQCRDLAGQIELAKRRIGELETQRQQITGSGGRSYTDDIVRELARNSCGANYQRDASRPTGPGGIGVPGFGDDSEGAASGGGYRSSQYETYRTVCVRLCDGYYFPISFSTLPGHFQQDADACQSKCAAPVELYYHKNPGEAMEQARSIKGEDPYTKLKTAFRYRKEFVQGCSCKEAEYVPPAGTVTVPMPVPAAPGAADRRAETLPWDSAPAKR